MRYVRYFLQVVSHGWNLATREGDRTLFVLFVIFYTASYPWLLLWPEYRRQVRGDG